MGRPAPIDPWLRGRVVNIRLFEYVLLGYPSPEIWEE